MSIDKLDHYSIRTRDLESTRRFYTEVIGFTVGPRPNFNFPGIWLYQDGVALVHVVGVDPDDPSGLIAYLGDKALDESTGGGSIDHVAFIATDLEGMRTQFRGQDIAFRERSVPNLALHQIFLEDPNGITIELNFKV